MRVISGTARGMPLRAPSTNETRPITDRAKEALFNIFSPKVLGCRFLDLFAGGGGVGIEALSRGADGATFVERSRKIAADLRYNLERTGLADRAVVRQVDVFEFLAQAPTPFDIAFIAPPQWLDLWTAALRIIDGEPRWLCDDGVVAVQHDPREHEAVDLENLVEYDQRKYGGVHFVFYGRR